MATMEAWTAMQGASSNPGAQASGMANQTDPTLRSLAVSSSKASPSVPPSKKRPNDDIQDACRSPASGLPEGAARLSHCLARQDFCPHCYTLDLAIPRSDSAPHPQQ